MKNNRRFVNWIPILVVFLILVTIFNLSQGNNVKKFSYNEFMAKAEQMTSVKATVSVGYTIADVSGVYTEGDKQIPFTVTVPNTNDNINKVTGLLGRDGNEVKVVDATEKSIFLTLLEIAMPILLTVGLMLFVLTRMNPGNQVRAHGASKAWARIEGNIKIRFKDVAGCDEEKEEVKEIIDYLKAPKKFSDMGARIPKGVLMVGPPGTGKTLLAKAVAGEANVPFFSVSGSDFVEMFVGMGASRVRDLFKKAQQAAPCIIFIDEIDAVGRQRGAGMGGGNDEREQTLNQMLVEMDGMSENKGIVIIAATNRPDVLDPALLRSGRFDRQITVNLPDKKGRTEILQVHAASKKLADDVNLENLAKRTPGFSGADLENVLNEGAILAVRDDRTEITMDDLDEAIDRVMMGPAKKSKKYSDEEKRLVAYHEAGHAIIGLKLKNADMVQKITIIPRGEAGGYNLMTPREEKLLPTKSDYLAQITGLLGGRVAEQIVFDEISAGASGDIQRITKIAKAMVKSFGMSPLGPVQYGDHTGNVFLGRDYGSGDNYSDETAFQIDQEVRKIINDCYEECTRVIKENMDLLHLIAKTLIEEETITHEQIMNLVDYGTLHPEKKEEKVEEGQEVSSTDEIEEV
ncbi:MAG: ATP-dependent zinc metalloprotease FtsH [Erysipelotrichaceae bacterium]|nr:ATP-dependent zinc metalloprotease FtsH [Erysipelotrichaceae bacterium]